MRVRKYESYDEYIAHQKIKTLKPKVKNISENRFQYNVGRFTQLFKRLPKYLKKGSKALCLGARRGEEIVALKSYGYNAIGVDLVAFPPNVIEADFHNLPFKDGSFDFVFSNAIDHILDIEKFVMEITRVVKRKGYVLLHLAVGKWSDEMSFGINSHKEVFKYFKEKFKVCKKFSHKCYSHGGLNYSILMKKTKN